MHTYHLLSHHHLFLKFLLFLPSSQNLLLLLPRSENHKYYIFTRGLLLFTTFIFLPFFSPLYSSFQTQIFPTMQQIQWLDDELRKTIKERDVALEQLHEAKEEEKNEEALKFAMEVEETNQAAMEDLAQALREVIVECNEVKTKLVGVQSELRVAKMEEERYREEANDSKKVTEKLEKRVEFLEVEADEAFLTWNEKERGFVECMRKAEEEYREMEKERDEWRVEKKKVRDIMKQALKEANTANQGAAMAMVESAQLKEEMALQKGCMEELRRENEKLCSAIRGLKVHLDNKTEENIISFNDGDVGGEDGGRMEWKKRALLRKFGSFIKRGR